MQDSSVQDICTDPSHLDPYFEANEPKQEDLRWRLGPLAVKMSGPQGRKARAALRLPAWAVRAGLFQVQRVVLRNSLLKLAGVFLASVPVVLFGAVFYELASGTSFWDGIVHIYGALYKIPGVTVFGEVNKQTEQVMNIAWLGGSFTFAILLGVVTEDITNYVAGVREGNIAVEADNHTLILNWNDDTLPLLRQIAVSRRERDNFAGPVVILANRPKLEMDAECNQGLAGMGLDVDTRSGVPFSVTDLEKVAAGTARTVLLLSNDHVSADAGKQQAAAVLGVQTCRSNLKTRPGLRLLPQNIAVQEAGDAEDTHMVACAKSLADASTQRLQLTVLDSRRDISALAAQSAIQPGVASVYCSIVQQAEGTSGFYLKSFKELDGLSFGQARRAFNGVVVCGYMRRDNGKYRTILSPNEREMLQEGDQMIALAKNVEFQPNLESAASYIFPAGFESANALKEVRDDPVPGMPPGKRIIIAWFNHDLEDLANALACFAPDYSQATVICANELEGLPKEETKGPCKFRLIHGDPTKTEMLNNAGVENADSLIVGGIEHKDHREADAVMLAMLMVLQDACARYKRSSRKPLHVIGQIRRQETVTVANHLLERLGEGQVTAELLQPDELVSGMMAQIAAEPNMASLLTDFIYSPEGRDLGLRPPTDYYIKLDEPCSFELISELCRLRGETALGYIATDDGNVQLNPLAKASRVFDKDDRIIVLARG
ncbi:hypothetical protein WJX84_011733 [Apatococcus fuscideae]|uniref:CASTOR/POLLUX/SYM8 ion channel conserved domain-containing protein n=1 Tax=Apatococcus fuscideae TaxID=2026836 RepID=A0AAW1SY70_9CHLO